MSGASFQMLLSSGLYVNGRSLSFNGSSKYLYRGGNSSANGQKFTIAFWYKRAAAGQLQMLYVGRASASNFIYITLTAVDRLGFVGIVGGANLFIATSPTLFADTTAWHHVCLAVDTTQATAADRLKLWHDWSPVTWDGSSSFPPQNATLSVSATGVDSYIGLYPPSYYLWNGLLDEFYYLDGQVADPGRFVLEGRPRSVIGFTGVADIALRFEDPTSTTTLGLDGSGTGGNWTLSGMSTSDSSTSVP